MKTIILIGLIAGLILISGCGQTAPTCNKPYILVGNECCLDKDDNSICDKDEIKREETEKDKLLTTQPVQALTVEVCTDNSYFECPYSYISKEEIKFKLRAKKADSFIIKKISFPNIPCEKEFEVPLITCAGSKDPFCKEGAIDKNKGLKFDEVMEFNIPCKFMKDSVDSEISIDGIFFPHDASYEERQPITIKSWISGMIR